MLQIAITNPTSKIVKIIGKPKDSLAYQEWNTSAATIKIDDYETIKVMIRPHNSSRIVGNESILLNISLQGDFNRLSFSLSMRNFKELMIIGSYGLLGFAICLALLFFKVCRNEFFKADIIQNEIDSMDVHQILQKYVNQKQDKKRPSVGVKKKQVVTIDTTKGDEVSQRVSKGSFY